jgi:ABC-type proline/glycine betaine transport system substrate-binding protein
MANVYTTLSNATVYTDKLQISTGNTAVTCQVYAVALGTAAAAGNLYSVPIGIPANTVFETYSGAGNKVTIAGSNWTALELGTASSATAGVIGAGS